MMAKSSKSRSMVRDDVRRVRTRYAEALRAGHSHIDAAALANGNDPIIKVKRIDPLPPQPSRDQVITKTIRLSGDAAPNSSLARVRPEHRVEIPPPLVKAAENPNSERPELEPPKLPELKIERVDGPDRPKVVVPKDWQDLPWPDLKSLAERISGGEIKSRKLANEVIDKAAQGK